MHALILAHVAADRRQRPFSQRSRVVNESKPHKDRLQSYLLCQGANGCDTYRSQWLDEKQSSPSRNAISEIVFVVKCPSQIVMLISSLSLFVCVSLMKPHSGDDRHGQDPHHSGSVVLLNSKFGCRTKPSIVQNLHPAKRRDTGTEDDNLFIVSYMMAHSGAWSYRMCISKK